MNFIEISFELYNQQDKSFPLNQTNTDPESA